MRNIIIISLIHILLPISAHAYTSKNVDISQLFKKVDIPQLLEIYKKGDAKEKQVVLNHLTVLGSSSLEYAPYKTIENFEPIIKTLQDKDANIRASSATFFKKIIRENRSSQSNIIRNYIVPALLQSLKDKSPIVRSESVKALGFYEHDSITEDLIMLLDDSDFAVRYETIKALGKVSFNGKAILPLLNIVIFDDIWPHKILQQEALKSIKSIYINNSTEYESKYIIINKKILSPKQHAYLIEIILNKINDPYLTIPAIQLAGLFDEDCIKDKLIEKIGNENNDLITKEIILSLGENFYHYYPFNNTNSRIEKYRYDVIKCLINMLNKESEDVKIASAKILGVSNSDQAIKPLIKLLNIKSKTVKIQAINSLKNFSNKLIIDPILTELNTTDRDIIKNGLECIYNYDDSKILPILPQFFGLFGDSTKNGDIASHLFLKIAKTIKKNNVIAWYDNNNRFKKNVSGKGHIVIPKDSEPYWHINSPLAAKFLITSLQKPREKTIIGSLELFKYFDFDEKKVKPILMKLLEDTRPGVKRAALKVDSIFYPHAAVPVIRKALKDENEVIRFEATEILKNLQKSDDIDTFSVLLHDGDISVKQSAAKKISGIYDPNLIPYLLELTDDITIRRYIVSALSKYKDKRILEKLLEISKNHRFTSLYNSVDGPLLDALSDYKDQRVDKLFLKLLEHKDSSFQNRALKYFQEKPNNNAVDIIIPLLQKDNLPTPAEAAKTLGIIGDPRAKDPLIKALSEQIDITQKNSLSRVWQLKKQSLIALGSIGDKSIYDILVKALNDKKLEESAITALGKLGDKRAIPILKTYVNKSNPMRHEAIKAMGEIGDPVVLDFLLPLMTKDKIYQIYIAEAIARIKNDIGIEILIKHIGNGRTYNDGSILKAIGSTNNKKNIPLIIKIAGEKEPIANSALSALEKYKNINVLDTLFKIIENDNDQTQILGSLRILDCYIQKDDYLFRQHIENNMIVLDRKTENKNILNNNQKKNIKKHTNNKNINIKLIASNILEKISGNDANQNNKIKLLQYNNDHIFSSCLIDEKKYKENPFYYFQQGPMLMTAGYDTETSKKNYDSNDPTFLIKKIKSKYPYDIINSTQKIAWLNLTNAIPDIINLLINTDEKIRVTAIKSLGHLKSEAAANNLIFSLNDPSLGIKRVSIWALGEIKESKTEKLIIDHSLKYNSTIRNECFTALSKFNTKAANNFFLKVIALNNDYTIWNDATNQLIYSKEKEATEVLLSRIDDKNEKIARAAIRAIGTLKNKIATQPLLEKIKSYNTQSNINLVTSTIWSLGEINDPSSLSEISKYLYNDNKAIREASFSALSKFQYRQVKAICETALSNPDFRVRRASVETLRLLDNKFTAAALNKMVDDENIYVRNAAANALKQEITH